MLNWVRCIYLIIKMLCILIKQKMGCMMSAVNPGNSFFYPVSGQGVASFSNEEAVEEAVQAVRKGVEPYTFVDVLTGEEKQFFDSLSNEKLLCAFEQPDVHYGFNRPSIALSDKDDPEIKKASTIIKRVIQALDSCQLSGLKIAFKTNVPYWHIDGGFGSLKGRLVVDQKERCQMRAVWAFKGPTTQVLVPTKSECERFLKTGKVWQRVMEEITKIAEADPARVRSGNDYALCIFHAGTIHRGFPSGSPEYPDRVVFAATDSVHPTRPIRLQFTED